MLRFQIIRNWFCREWISHTSIDFHWFFRKKTEQDSFPLCLIFFVTICCFIVKFDTYSSSEPLFFLTKITAPNTLNRIQIPMMIMIAGFHVDRQYGCKSNLSVRCFPSALSCGVDFPPGISSTGSTEERRITKIHLNYDRFHHRALASLLHTSMNLK